MVRVARSTAPLGAVLIALLSACVGPFEPAPSSPAAPSLRDTIVVGISQEPDTLFDPISTVPAESVIHAALSQGLTVRDQDNRYVARLAEQTPTLENGGAKIAKTADGRDQLSVTYRIREGARFSNGMLVTSGDVKSSWRLYLNTDVPVVSRAAAQRYEDIQTPDERTATVVYRPGELDPLYFSFCCTIVPRQIIESLDPKTLKDSSFSRDPVFAGPYRLKEWLPGASITLEANADFWLGKPRTKYLAFKFVGETGALLSQLRGGQLDAATNDAISLEQVPELDALSAAGGIRVRYTPAQIWEHIDINLRDPADASKPHPILADVAVRKALAAGIDRDRLAKQLLYGKVNVIDSFIFGAGWAAAAASEINTYAFDREAARGRLEEAGWKLGTDGVRVKDGRRLQLKLASTSGNATRQRTSDAVASDLRALGIDLTVTLIPPSQLFAPRGAGPLSAANFDLALYAWVQGDDPRTYLYSCEQIPIKENNFSGQNYPGYCDRDFDRAIGDANNRIPQSERRPLYLEAQRIWTRDVPVIPLYQRPNIDVARAALRNFRNAPTSTPVTVNAFEWELPT